MRPENPMWPLFFPSFLACEQLLQPNPRAAIVPTSLSLSLSRPEHPSNAPCALRRPPALPSCAYPCATNPPRDNPPLFPLQPPPRIKTASHRRCLVGTSNHREPPCCRNRPATGAASFLGRCCRRRRNPHTHRRRSGAGTASLTSSRLHPLHSCESCSLLALNIIKT